MSARKRHSERLRRFCQHLRPSRCAGLEEEAAAFRCYCQEGEARAAALGNRGPVRFDADGRLAADILQAYWRHGFYVLEGVLSEEELRELQSDFHALAENAPLAPGGKIDRHGRSVRHPDAYVLNRPLSDPMGGGPFAVHNFAGGETVGRHPMKMREPESPEGAPEYVIQNIARPLLCMDSALRVYGHPLLLRVAEALNGPDFTPFTEALFYKPAGLGISTAWHQDPSNAWDEAWSKPGFDVGTCGFSFHVALTACTAENGLWMLPGSHFRGRVDVKALSAGSGGSDRLPGAVPIVCKPGDVYIQNRLPLHGAFANVSAEPRVTLQMGFNRRSSVLGVQTKGYGGRSRVYDERYVEERSRMIALAIDARRHRYPHEAPYVYQPFAGREHECRWSEELKATSYGKYWQKDIVI